MKPSDHQLLAFNTKWSMVLNTVSRDPFTLGLWMLPIAWTLLLAVSLWLTITQLTATIQDLALVAARTSFQRDILIRQWAANHGGVYVPVTDQTPPNPYLTNVPERDIITPSGRQLTLMNPAYITRQLYELGREIDHASGHITSLNPIRPENAPDEWERQALQSFERGVTEVSAIEDLNGAAHLRLMRPLITNESCLPCHAAQGYQVGDIRGGISVAVPVKDYAAIVNPNQRNAVLIHGSIWATGLGLIVAGLWQTQRRRREREQATAALRESEARFRSYFELPLAGRAITSPGKGWLEVNATLCDMLGYSQSELMQMTWAELTHPDDLAADQTQFDRVMAGEIDGYTLEKRFICKDGRFVQADLAVQCVRRPDRSVDYLVALIQDITARKQAENLMRSRLELVEFSASHSLDEVLQKTLDVIGELTGSPIGFYHFVESDQTTLSLQAWSTRTLQDYCHTRGAGLHSPIDQAGVWAHCARTRRPVVHNDYASLPDRKGLPDGHAALVRELVVPILRQSKVVAILGIGNKSGEYTDADIRVVEYFADIAWEIAERKRAEEALRASEEKLNAIFAGANIGIAITDRTGRYVMHNRWWNDYLGYDPVELAGKTNLDITHPDDVEPSRRWFMKALDGEIDRYRLEKRFVRKDGAIVWADLAVSPVKNDRGEVIYMAGMVSDITERKRIEAALRQSEEKHRILFTHSPDAYLIITDGIFVDCNHAAVAMLGAERTQIIGRPPAALSPEFQPDGRRSAEAAQARIAEALSAGASTFEWVHRRMDGSDFLVEVSISAMALEGQPALFVTWRDITARKQAEEALRQSEARWLSIIKTSPDGICLASIDGVIQYVSDKLLVMHSYERADEMIGRPIFEFLDPDYRAQAGLRLAAVLRGEYPGVIEYKVIRRDGSRFYAEINAEVLRDAAGQATGLLLVERDVDHRKRAEEALHRQNQYLIALQATTLELSAQLDLDRLFENIVARAAALVDAAGGFFDVVDPATNQLLPRVGMGVLAESLKLTAKPGEGVAGIVWQTGQPMVVNNYDHWAGRIGGFSYGKLGALIGVPLLNKGQILGVLGLAYEFNSPRTFGPEVVEILTQFARLAAIAIENARLFEVVQQELAERIRAEAALQDLNATLEQRVIDRTTELRAANARLVELDRLKDEFLSRISHELRTPLTSIKIYLELLESGKPERRDKYLQTLKSETDRLHTLIEEVLTFSQLNLNTMPAAAGPIDINNLIGGRLTTWERLSAGHGLKLHLNLAPDLPRARADAELVAQALSRLVANAVNYTPAGSVTVSTVARFDDGRRWVTINVSDTGPGITPDDAPHIFERFYRGRAAANYKTPGAGVGLAISREIAQQLGGRLTVETQVGVGSTFTLWLPEA